MGENMVMKLASNRFDIIFPYHNQAEKAKKIIGKIKKNGNKAVALPSDLGDIKSFASFFEQLSIELKEYFNVNRFDYLVNNAGIGMNISYMDTTEKQFDKLMNIQFKGVYFFTQQALAYMNDGGGIINISSRLAQSCMPGYSAYAAMKGAIETLTKYQAKELGYRGIKVNSVAPRPIATDFAGGIIRDNISYNEKIKTITALGRVGEPEDIGGVVAFLCTDNARWITAQRIEVSGGTGL
ncbi:NAD(P)-dependent dehydrogenase (short-subunit alcohol dehydrogenase family) [Sporomusaceae bacterium BoRhaA]|nr:NAD(P)-dependent dehydrogenase (short-subunit alcohol dehydrogenase family) [Pelorhabdus rhamnosifermentans]